MIGQMSIFDFLMPEQKKRDINNILSVGDKVGRVVLGECRIATITEVEGLPNYPFYRTDSGGCYTFEEGQQDIEELMYIAEEERRKYKTIIPGNLKERITVEYDLKNGRKSWAQIGIIENMLFWKEWCTYQFLEPYNSEKKLRKEYEKHKQNILGRNYNNAPDRILNVEIPMRRLYWSAHGFYADAEYVKTNG